MLPMRIAEVAVERLEAGEVGHALRLVGLVA